MYDTALKLARFIHINYAKEKCLRFLAVREHFGIFGNCLKSHSIAKKSHSYISRNNWQTMPGICIGNSVICSDIWHKNHEWYFKIVIRNFTRLTAREIWDNFEISQVVFMPNITTNHAIICLYYYPQKVCNFHM